MFRSQKSGFSPVLFIILSVVAAMLDLNALQKALNPDYEFNSVFKRKFAF